MMIQIQMSHLMYYPHHHHLLKLVADVEQN